MSYTIKFEAHITIENSVNNLKECIMTTPSPQLWKRFSFDIFRLTVYRKKFGVLTSSEAMELALNDEQIMRDCGVGDPAFEHFANSKEQMFNYAVLLEKIENYRQELKDTNTTMDQADWVFFNSWTTDTPTSPEYLSKCAQATLDHVGDSTGAMARFIVK